MDQKTSVSVLIPAYNEEASISDTINRIKVISEKENWDYEVIVIDDGSKDNTGQLAEAGGAKLIKHPQNIGYGLSIQHGIESSTKNLIALTDADGTYPIEELPNLVKMVISHGYDMSVGSRTGKEYKRGIWKYPARIVFKLLAEFVAGRRIPDINSGLRVMRKEKLLPHYKRTCYGFSFTTSITLIFLLNGYFVAYTPIPYSKRSGKSKVKHFRDTLRTAQIMISVISYYNPIKLFLLSAIFNVFFAIFILILGIVFEVFILIILGIMLIAVTPIILVLGVLAELIRLKNN